MKIEKELTKLYYSIGEVADLFDVSNSLIRYWESEFKQLKPQKNRKGDRRFTVKDIRVLEQIYTLVKERGFTLDGAKKEMRSGSKSTSKSDPSHLEVVEKLKSTLSKLEALRDRLSRQV